MGFRFSIVHLCTKGIHDAGCIVLARSRVRARARRRAEGGRSGVGGGRRRSQGGGGGEGEEDNDKACWRSSGVCRNAFGGLMEATLTCVWARCVCFADCIRLRRRWAMARMETCGACVRDRLGAHANGCKMVITYQSSSIAYAPYTRGVRAHLYCPMWARSVFCTRVRALSRTGSVVVRKRLDICMHA